MRGLCLTLGCCLLSACAPEDAPDLHEAVAPHALASAPGEPDTAAYDDRAHEHVCEVEADPRDGASYVFDQRAVHTYELTIDPDDLARIDKKPSNEEMVPATLRFEGRTIGPLGVRYKGSVGSFLAPCTAEAQLGRPPGPKVGKCAIKIAFDEVDDDARFYGLKKLNLHPMGRDDSMMRERLGYQLYRDMGIASPRTAHARVIINGKLEGLFLAVEQIDGQFTRSRFSDGGKGNLYKEVWPMYGDPAVYRAALETNKGKATDVDKMVRFRTAITAGPEQGLRWIDRDYMMRYLAVDRVIQNDDGMAHWYCNSVQGNNLWPLGNHNYYWYESQASERFWLVPWDLDSAFANHPRVHIVVKWSEIPKQASDCACRTGVGLPQRAPSCDALTASLAAREAEYEAAVARFLRGPFSAHLIHARLSRWAHQIAPFVDEAAGVLGAPDATTWRKRLDALRAVITSSRIHAGYDYSKEPLFPPLPPARAAQPRDAGVDAGAPARPTGLDAGDAMLGDAGAAPPRDVEAVPQPIAPP